MTSVYFTLDAAFSYSFTEDAAENDITSALDSIVEHLEDCLGVEDVFVVCDEHARTFTVSQLVASNELDSIETVVGRGMGALRTAFHACDNHTPGWPSPQEALLSVHVSPTQIEPTADTADPAGELSSV